MEEWLQGEKKDGSGRERVKEGEVKERSEGSIANGKQTWRDLLTTGDWKELQMAKVQSRASRCKHGICFH